MASQQQTGMRNEHYDIVSTLYHALQAAETSERYRQDAESAGDQEAAQFFREVQDQNRRLAERATHMLTQRVK